MSGKHYIFKLQNCYFTSQYFNSIEYSGAEVLYRPCAGQTHQQNKSSRKFSNREFINMTSGLDKCNVLEGILC